MARVHEYDKMRKEVCIYTNKIKPTLLLPSTKVFAFQNINTMKLQYQGFFYNYLYCFGVVVLIFNWNIYSFPLYPNTKVAISTKNISLENKDVSLLLLCSLPIYSFQMLAQTSPMRAPFLPLNNLVLASIGTRLLN